MTKEEAMEELIALAPLTDKDTGVYARRRKLWLFLSEEGVSQTDIAKMSKVGRSDVNKVVKQWKN
jgi:transposase